MRSSITLSFFVLKSKAIAASLGKRNNEFSEVEKCKDKKFAHNSERKKIKVAALERIFCFLQKMSVKNNFRNFGILKTVSTFPDKHLY